MQTEKQHLGILKNRYQIQLTSVVNLNLFIWFMKAKVYKNRVMAGLFYFEFP